MVTTAAAGDISAIDHRLEHGHIAIHLHEKYVAPLAHRPVVVLAHGSGSAGQESFDLQVPDRNDVSLMDVLAREGFDVFAFDVRGFGRSTRPETGVTTADAAEDVAAAIEHIVRLRDVTRVAVVAWSWGTQYAGMYVASHPDRVTRYVSHAQMHAGSRDLVRRRAQADVYRQGPYVEVSEPNWKKRFVSSTPDSLNDPAIVDAFARAVAEAEPRTPTGPQLDMIERMPMVDPSRLAVPVMMIHGEHDDVADLDGLLPFFRALPNADKRYVVIPGGGHMVHLQSGRIRFHAALIEFLSADASASEAGPGRR
jgi:pimeloyl-ACP methyl ester carboxylesterase